MDPEYPFTGAPFTALRSKVPTAFCMFFASCKECDQCASDNHACIDSKALVQDLPRGGWVDLEREMQHKMRLHQASEKEQHMKSQPRWYQRTAQTPVRERVRSLSSVGLQRLVISAQPREPPGLDVDLVDGRHIFVVAVREGAVTRENAKFTLQPHLQIRPNDRIVEINGVSGDAGALVAQLKETSTWDIRFQHPTEFNCTLQRGMSDSLGVDLRYAPGGNTLAVLSIGQGPVHDWNRDPASTDERVVSLYDRIIEMNWCRGSAVELLEASTRTDPLNMTILGYGYGTVAAQ